MKFATAILLLLAAAFAADRDLAGRFTGEWKSASAENNGTIRFTLEPQAGAAWKCDLAFVLNGGEIKAQMKEVKLHDGKLELTYDFNFDGASLHSRVKGEWDGKAFQGKYETAAGDQQVDTGSWTASRTN